MHIMNVHVNCSKRIVASHNASNVRNLITWSDFAKRINAALSAQINITLKNAWCLWIKDIVLTAMKITNSEDTSVSNNNSRWNKHLKSIETDRSNIQKHWNTIAHSCNSWTLRCLQTLQIQWTLQSSQTLSIQWTH